MMSGDSMAGVDGSSAGRSEMTSCGWGEKHVSDGGQRCPPDSRILPGGQMELFGRRPVEPEDLERDVRRPWLNLNEDLPSGRLPSVDEADPLWQRYGLGPVLDVPRHERNDLERRDRWGL